MTFDDVIKAHPTQIPEGFVFGVGEGWASIVSDFLTSTGATLQGVRQDMGVLRIDTAHPVDDRATMLAEFRSRTTCEKCGRPGHMRRATGNYRVRCDDHATGAERAEPPRPKWTYGRETLDGFLVYDQESDALQIVDDLVALGLPSTIIQQIEKDRAGRT